MEMLKVAALLFALAAAGGLGIGVIRLRGERNPPVWLAMLHGMIATAGFTLLAYAAWAVTLPASALFALLLFALAALGGGYMNLRFHWRNELLPRAFVWAHAALAVAGFVLLLFAVYG
jgi:hypothetical protein